MSEKPDKCEWCPSTGRLYKCRGTWLCCACVAEYYDMSPEECKELYEEEEKADGE